ncbi:MAG: hypothetical protein N5P05_002533 [Chroococcopsis gigantea SAG 12.99]|jgi:hypothetical protein|nr:hypothetical protein [Chroococcopsis gigantea SAG 12.99]
MNYFSRSCGGEEIPIGGLRVEPAIIQDVYRTRDGNGYFTFRFHAVNNRYEIDIVSIPGGDYSQYGRSGELHLTHRHHSSRGGHRICIGDDSFITDLDTARKWAGLWAEETWKYLTRGELFG